MKTITKTLFFMVLIFGFLLTGSCQQKETVAPDTRKIEPVKIIKPKAAHFIICIDNSKSITPPEQVMIRETAMLLTDLVEFGDKVSVITFGENARLVSSSQINADDDRTKFKRNIIEGVGFTESFSDIRAGLRLLAKNPQSPLVDQNFKPYIVLLSDGRLEPADHRVEEAFNEIKDYKSHTLTGMDIYTIVLGDKHCHAAILPAVNGEELTGVRLMREFISSASDTFYHAKELDQLLPIAVDIFKKSKGINAMGEEVETNRFRIDNTVNTMTLIVRKKSVSGDAICQSSDIVLDQPDSSSGEGAQSVYRGNEYQYFDLIVVRKPAEGIWSITLQNNNIPEILCKIDTPVELQYIIRDSYYINETSMINAWMYDRDKSSVINIGDFRIKAHLAKSGEIKESTIYHDLEKATEAGQFYMGMPQGLPDDLRADDGLHKIDLEIISQRVKPGSADLDPWFIRKSKVFTINLLKPFINWRRPAVHQIKLPFFERSLNFGADMDLNAQTYPGFETPPSLKFTFEAYDEKNNSYVIKSDDKIKGTPDNKMIKYQNDIALKNLEPGVYRYSYQLVDGVLKNGGPFSIKSPVFIFNVKSYSYDSWEFWVACVILVLSALCIIRRITAKIQGTIIIDGKKQLLYSKLYISDANFVNKFILKAKKRCILKSVIILRVIQGKVIVDEKHVLNQGQLIMLFPGKHTIAQEEGGKKIETKLMANV